jgi:hypothetical protein
MARPRRRGKAPLMLAVSTSKKDARTFLQKLATDDSFRRRLTNDPVGTLERAGVMISADALPAKIALPPKDVMSDFISTGALPRPNPVRIFSPCRLYAVLYAIAGEAE